MDIEILSNSMMLRYGFVFFIPTIYLFVLATFVYARSYHLKIAKLIAAFLFCGAIGYTFDFVRVLSLVEYNHTIHLFIVLPLVNLAFALSLHLVYLLVKPVKDINIPYIPKLFYSLPIIMFIYGLCELLLWGQPEYYKLDGMVYRADGSTILLNFVLALFFYVVNLVLLFIGYKYAKTNQSKNLFLTCVIFTISLIVLIIFWNLGLVDFSYFIPPTSGLFLILLTGTLFTFLIASLDFIPSIVKRYSSMMETAPTPIIYLNENREIVEVNTIARNTFQFKEKTSLKDYFDFKVNPYSLDSLFKELEEKNHVKDYKIVVEDEFAEKKYLLIDASTISFVEETLYFFIIHDVTIEEKNREYKDFLAYHDYLTELYNRAYFEKNVRHTLKKLEQTTQGAALVLFDLNYFKTINDTYGHQVGDQVLIHASKLFEESLPQPNVLARLGGDEFIAFFEVVSSKEQFLEQMEFVRNHFQQKPFKRNGLIIYLLPSIGAAFTKEEGFNYGVLYDFADLRMYDDKKQSKKLN